MTVPSTEAAAQPPTRLPGLLAPGAAGRRTRFVRIAADGTAAELTGEELAPRATAFGAALLTAVPPDGAGPSGDDRVVLSCRDPLAFVTAFFGVLAAGLVPVPAPGALLDHPGRRERLRGILGVESARALVTDEVLPDGTAGPVPVLTVDALTSGTPERVPDPGTAGAPDPRRTAYVQYTSGSVGAPQPVELADHHVLAQLRQAAEAFAETPRSVSVNWVPLHHDMGLVTSVLRPLWSGYTSVLLDPFDFVARPAHWIEALTAWRATHTSAPDFGYALTARKATAEGADLSSLRVARSAGEPVRVATLREFTRVFAPAGLRPTAITPSYGLAEATLTVTACPLGEEPRVLAVRAGRLAAGEAVRADPAAGRTAEVVSCGPPLRGTKVRVLDPETSTPLPDGRTGEVWIHGPQVSPTAKGRHVLDGTAGHRTGDMGFLHGGELYLLGRAKERFQIGGENFYCGEIEAVASGCAPRLRPGRAAAFLTVPAGTAEPVPVLVAEVRAGAAPDEAELAALARTVVRAVGRGLGLPLRRVWMAAAGTLPVTTSGKIQRERARQLFEDGTLPSLHRYERGNR